MISRFARLHPPPRRLTQGERAALFGALFAATLGVMIFAATLGYAGCFLLAMAWTLVLVEVDRWAGPRGG